MALTMVAEDGTDKCAACSHFLSVKKGQLLPPCPRCGGTMEKHEGEKHEGPPPEPQSTSCE